MHSHLLSMTEGEMGNRRVKSQEPGNEQDDVKWRFKTSASVLSPLQERMDNKTLLRLSQLIKVMLY